MSAGYAVSYWPGTDLVKSVVAVENEKSIAPGCVFLEWGSELPVAADAPLTSQQIIDTERQWRDSELNGVLWLRERHRDQIEIGLERSLTSEQFTNLLIYVQKLRDWPQSKLFPDSTQRPDAPAWLSQAS